jgi:hypothetical protein
LYEQHIKILHFDIIFWNLVVIKFILKRSECMKRMGYVFFLSMFVVHGALVGMHEEAPVDEEVKAAIDNHNRAQEALFKKQEIEKQRLGTIRLEYDENVRWQTEHMHTDEHEKSIRNGLAEQRAKLNLFRKEVLGQNNLPDVRTGADFDKAQRDLEALHQNQQEEFDEEHAAVLDFIKLKKSPVVVPDQQENFVQNNDDRLPPVSKGRFQKIVDSLKDFFWKSGDLADTRESLQKSNLLHGSFLPGEQWASRKESLKTALKNLTLDQSLDVINDYLDTSSFGNKPILVKRLNEIFPENQQVKLGANDKIVQA